jgi:hypothetical protein
VHCAVQHVERNLIIFTNIIYKEMIQENPLLGLYRQSFALSNNKFQKNALIEDCLYYSITVGTINAVVFLCLINNANMLPQQPTAIVVILRYQLSTTCLRIVSTAEWVEKPHN